MVCEFLDVTGGELLSKTDGFDLLCYFFFLVFFACEELVTYSRDKNLYKGTRAHTLFPPQHHVAYLAA